MTYPVARVGSIVQVGSQQGKVITGASSHFVDGGGAAAGADGVSPNIAEAESVGMETEDMSDSERRTYLNNRYGPGAADSMIRGAGPSQQNPGSLPTHPLNPASAPVSCSGFTNNSPDSTQISKYFTVANFSSAIYEAQNSHNIPTTTALGLSRAQVICNLKFLATNSIDPFSDWLKANTSYNFKIGSGFRNNTNGSDHNIGSASDLHIFDGSGQRISRDSLRQLATTLVNSANIPFTQFLLEYTGGSSFGWIHLANRQTGGPSALKVGYTFTGNAPYFADLPRSA